MRYVAKALLLSAASLAFAGAANAALLDYQLTGSYQAHFRIDSNPVVADPDINGFAVEGVYNRNAANTAFVNYPGTTVPVADIIFYSLDNGNLGGLEIDDNYSSSPKQLLVTDGPLLYTGSTSSPTLRTGVFNLTQSSGGTGRYVLTVTQVASVPEPSTWAMLLLGFVGLGFLAYRKPKMQLSTPCL